MDIYDELPKKKGPTDLKSYNVFTVVWFICTVLLGTVVSYVIWSL